MTEATLDTTLTSAALDARLDARVAKIVNHRFPAGFPEALPPHLLLGLTLEAMRAFTRTHPRGPETHICPEFCRKLSEPARSERGWTEGSNELPRTSRRFTIERSTLRDVLVLERPINAVLARCAQCDGALVFRGASARGCPGCKWYLCGACVRSPATNGYENQEVILQFATPRRRSVAELLLEDPATAAGVGAADFFVSWFLGQKLEALFDALETYMARARLDPATTYFWVCDYVIRQGGIDDCAPGSRFENLTLSVCTIGRTLLLADPWHDPRPLRRSWCLWEILSSGALELILSSSQEEHFRRALVRDFDGIETIRTSVSNVDLRNSDTRNPEDQRTIFQAVRERVGMSTLNARVHARLRAWLAQTALAELAKLPAAERATSALINNVARLLEAAGKLGEAEPLYREAFEGRRETLGPTHPHTLTAMGNLAGLLHTAGKLHEAEHLLREALMRSREMLYSDHGDEMLKFFALHVPDAKEFWTRDSDLAVSLQNQGSLKRLALLLRDMGRHDEAETLFREQLETQRKRVSSASPDLAESLNNLALVLQAQGKLDEAATLFCEACECQREALGPVHPGTLTSMCHWATLLQAKGELDKAEALSRQALEGQRETLGLAHPETLASMTKLGHLLRRQSKFDESEALFREVLERCRETLGDEHPDTRAALKSLRDKTDSEATQFYSLPTAPAI